MAPEVNPRIRRAAGERQNQSTRECKRNRATLCRLPLHALRSAEPDRQAASQSTERRTREIAAESALMCTGVRLQMGEYGREERASCAQSTRGGSACLRTSMTSPRSMRGT